MFVLKINELICPSAFHIKMKFFRASFYSFIVSWVPFNSLENEDSFDDLLSDESICTCS